MGHGLSSVVIRLQSLLFFLFVSVYLALSTVTATPYGNHDGKGRSGGLGFPVTGTFAPLYSLTDLVTGAARLTATIINGLVALLNQTLG